MQLPFNTNTLTQAIKPNNSTKLLKVTKLPEYTHAEVCPLGAKFTLGKPIYLQYAIKQGHQHDKP